MKTVKIFLMFLVLSVLTFGQSKTVIVAEINGEVDLGLAPYLSRVVEDGNSKNVSAIIIKINTFGGRLDAATQIKDAIFTSKVPVIAFINNRAISAGALIALSCNKIIMTPGSVMGAATVVDQTGQKQSEKYQAYMRSEMRSTAEKRGRNTNIAQGMVDERIVIPELNDNGDKLISLTTEEAIKTGMADTTLNNLSEILKYLDMPNAVVLTETSNWAEDFVKFLNNPVVSSILLMIGFLGIMAEIKAPGHGAGAIAAVIALALFFGSSYILQMASFFEIILFIVGIILIALEIFVIPGFGVAGVLGIILVIASIFMSLMGTMPIWDMNHVSTAVLQLGSALVASIILIMILIKYLPKSERFNKLVLKESIGKGVEFAVFPGKEKLLNAEGIAISTLRPAGIADFNGDRIDVVTEGDYVEAGTKIKVIRIEGVKVVVTVMS
ncbi:MAG: NfeD family protein [Bacteroidota bacterium]|nr:NfeD family protein [Bacteroidota bacterium]